MVMASFYPTLTRLAQPIDIVLVYGRPGPMMTAHELFMSDTIMFTAQFRVSF